jgi:RNA polymerase sigma factor (sigma-70 family)
VVSLDNPVTLLVAAARDGDTEAWNSLVDRYAGLVMSICRRYRLGDSDAADVSQTVWLRLVESLGSLRDPEALPGWLATTARRECLGVLRGSRRAQWAPLNEDIEVVDDPAVDDVLLEAELHDALRRALSELPERCRTLLQLLTQDPPPSYDSISATLGMPMGGIGPTRARCLDKLRRCPSLAPLVPASAGTPVPGMRQRSRP